MFIKSWLGLVHNWYKPHLLHTHGGEPRWIKPRSLPLGQTGYFNLLHNCVHISFHFIFFFVWYFFVPCGRFGSHNLGKAQQPQEQRYPFLSVCVIFSSIQTMVWLPVFAIFNVCTDVDVCDSTQGGCADTVRESALEADSGRKIPCCTGDLNLCQYCAWLFSWTLYHLNCSHPSIVCCSWIRYITWAVPTPSSSAVAEYIISPELFPPQHPLL